MSQGFSNVGNWTQSLLLSLEMPWPWSPSIYNRHLLNHVTIYKLNSTDLPLEAFWSGGIRLCSGAMILHRWTISLSAWFSPHPTSKFLEKLTQDFPLPLGVAFTSSQFWVSPDAVLCSRASEGLAAPHSISPCHSSKRLWWSAMGTQRD